MICKGPRRGSRYLRFRTFFQGKSRQIKTPDGASEAALPQLKSPRKFKSSSNDLYDFPLGDNHTSGAGVSPSQAKLVRPRFAVPKRPLKASNDAEDNLASTNNSHAGVCPSLTNTVGPRFHPLEFPLNKANNLAEEASVSMKLTTTLGAQAPRTPARPSGSGPSPPLPSRWDIVGRRPELRREQRQQGVKRFGAVFHSMGSRLCQGPEQHPPLPSRWDLVGRRPELGRDHHQQGVKRFGAVFHPMGSRLCQGPERADRPWARTTSTPTNSR